jgi:flagellar motor switch protein FliN/FliY
VEDGLGREPRPRDPILVSAKENRTMSQPTSATGPSSPATEASPLDVPVTLTVELGRVNLTLSRLADLKPGDVIELGRHSRAPVEMTSNGRLVARGELILIDTDLGVRVTSVFL